MKLEKTRPVHMDGLGSFLSAEWQIREVPGLYLRKAYAPGGPVGSSNWGFSLRSGSHWVSDDTRLAEAIYGQLEGQEFQSRRDALGAVKTALEMLS